MKVQFDQHNVSQCGGRSLEVLLQQVPLVECSPLFVSDWATGWVVVGAAAYRSTGRSRSGRGSDPTGSGRGLNSLLSLFLFLSEVPKILVPEDEVEVDQQVRVTCLIPIDYGGGQCRLFRDGSLRAFRTARANYFQCRFMLPARELLASRPVGSIVYFRCDYQLQQYTSALSDLAGVTVRG